MPQKPPYGIGGYWLVCILYLTTDLRLSPVHHNVRILRILGPKIKAGLLFCIHCTFLYSIVQLPLRTLIRGSLFLQLEFVICNRIFHSLLARHLSFIKVVDGISINQAKRNHSRNMSFSSAHTS